MNDLTTQPDQARDADSRGEVDARMKCPSCGSSDLRVSAEITCTVVQKQSPNGDWYDALQILTGSEPYWDRDTFTSCADCYHDSAAKDFEPASSASPSKAEVCHGDD